MRSSCFSILVAALFGGLSLSPSASADPPERTITRISKPAPTLTVSKEITHVTGPVRENGTIDYVAALNEMASEGVTNENNAAIPFLQSFGPEGPESSEEWMRNANKELGLDPLPEDGAYLTDLDEVFGGETKVQTEEGERAWQQVMKNQNTAMSRPWTRDEFPVIARWLDTNEKPLSRIADGLKRDRWYVPYLTAEDSDNQFEVVSILLPSVQESRSVARLSVARAMLAMGENRDADALADVQRMLWLSGHLGNASCTLIESLVAIAIERIAFTAESQLIERGRLTDADWAGYLEALEERPKFRPIGAVIGSGERFMMLDAISTIQQAAIRGDTETLEEFEGLLGVGEKALGATMMRFIGNRVKWDDVARRANRFYNRLAVFDQMESREKRIAAETRLEEDLKRRIERVRGIEPQDLPALLTEPQRVSETVTDVLLSLLIPATRQVHKAFDRVEIYRDLRAVGIALARYKLANGNYPETLAPLTPNYLAEKPTDFFSEGGTSTLLYERTEDGFRLYSVGENGADNGGQLDYSRENEDDFNLVIPVPPEDD